MNRAAERLQLVKDGGPPRCPACGETLLFGSDRHGQTIARCQCGYRAFVERRTGKREPPPTTAS
jgi:DNA-directed RNA polymerase subunit RPC12/RpoP